MYTRGNILKRRERSPYVYVKRHLSSHLFFRFFFYFFFFSLSFSLFFLRLLLLIRSPFFYKRVSIYLSTLLSARVNAYTLITRSRRRTRKSGYSVGRTIFVSLPLEFRDVVYF